GGECGPGRLRRRSPARRRGAGASPARGAARPPNNPRLRWAHGGGAEFWHNGRPYPASAGLSPHLARSVRPATLLDPTRAPARPPMRTRSVVGRQDPSEADGKDPRTVLPDRRRRLPHQAGRPGDRGDRQVPPRPGALADRGELRASAVLARGGCSADRASARHPQDHPRLAPPPPPPPP